MKVTGELYGRGSVGIYLGKLRRGGCVGQTLSACESGPGHERRENSQRVELSRSLGSMCSTWVGAAQGGDQAHAVVWGAHPLQDRRTC